MARGVGEEAHASPVRSKPPVRREGDEAIAVGAGDSAGPEVAVRSAIVFGFVRKHACQSLTDFFDEQYAELLELPVGFEAMGQRPFDGGSKDQRRHWVEIISDSGEPESRRLGGDASASSSRIEDDGLVAP